MKIMTTEEKAAAFDAIIEPFIGYSQLDIIYQAAKISLVAGAYVSDALEEIAKYL